MKFYKYIIVLFACFLVSMGFSQDFTSSKLKIGQPCPAFTLKGVENYKKRTVSLSDLAGKYVILDFWSLGCTSCISGFKKLDPLQKKFKDRLQVLLIGQDNFKKEGLTEEAKYTFNSYSKRWNLDLANAYDAKLFSQVEIPIVPLYIWIDPRGIVKAITNATELTEENLLAFFEGREIIMGSSVTVDPDQEDKFDYRKPLLISGNGGSDTVFLFRSILAKWNVGVPGYWQPFISSVTKKNGTGVWSGVRKNRVQLNGASLRELIELAYGDTVSHTPRDFDRTPDTTVVWMHSFSSYGRYWRRPVLEIADTADFRINWATGEGLYAYSLTIPKVGATAARLREAMQRDLTTYFPYDISVEMRSMPCWYLTADETAREKLKADGGRPYWILNVGHLQVKNLPMYQIIRYIFANNDKQPPIIDQTGIKDPICIDLKGAMMDIEEVRSCLKAYGLHLKKGRKDMSVIVVRDRKQ